MVFNTTFKDWKAKQLKALRAIKPKALHMIAIKPKGLHRIANIG
jgi:hypothetical protein